MNGSNTPIMPAPDTLNELEYGKFVLTNLAARRAKQIKEGAPPLVRINSSHPLSIALAEIAAGKIKPIIGEQMDSIEEDELTLELEDDTDFMLPGLEDEDDEDAIRAVDLEDEEFDFEDDDSEDEEDDETTAVADDDDLSLGDLADEEDEAPSADSDADLSLEDLAEDENQDDSEESDD